jgi:hypothetical protein
VRFSVKSRHPYPFNLCYCSICRKTAGAGDFAINLSGDATTLEVEGAEHVRTYRAKMRDSETGGEIRRSGERKFCDECGSALWLWDPSWPELVHPHASAIDAPLPILPERTHDGGADQRDVLGGCDARAVILRTGLPKLLGTDRSTVPVLMQWLRGRIRTGASRCRSGASSLAPQPAVRVTPLERRRREINPAGAAITERTRFTHLSQPPHRGRAGPPHATPRSHQRTLPLDIRDIGHNKALAADDNGGRGQDQGARTACWRRGRPDGRGRKRLHLEAFRGGQNPKENAMAELTDEGRRRVEEIAQKHGVSAGAAETLLAGLVAGGGNQAQFSHPELGGMGQWSRGGMVMVGDMFNNALKAKVDALCTELAGLLGYGRPFIMQSQSQGGGGGVSLFVSGSSVDWWPGDLGVPAAVGAQNDLRYAWFPGTRRLAVQYGGRVRVFDTGDHSIGGVSQQQGGEQSITFTSQHGTVRLDELRPVDRGGASEASAPAAASTAPVAAKAPAAPETNADPAAPSVSRAEGDIFVALERLADLRAKGVLTDEEFAAKKAEMLARL